MGRKGGGRFFEKSLRRRIEICTSKYSTAEEIANHLRSTYPDYHRTKQQTLIRFVQEAIHSMEKLNHTPTLKYSDDGNIEPQRASRKRKKNIDEGEERLKKMEALHVRRRVQSSSESNDEESNDEESNDEESVSEDAIYGEKLEPQFDLMKEMLRMSYTPKKVAAAATEEKNIEIEMGNISKGTEMGNISKVTEMGNRSKATVLNDVGDPSLLSVSVSNGEGKKDWPRFKDFGGMKEVLEELREELIVPLVHGEILRKLGGKPKAVGILLQGPPGCGKTTLAHAIANESGLPYYRISATELVSGVSGASEENIREFFAKAYRTAPSIVFIDEIDAIGSKRENLQREMEKRMVMQLSTCMDQSSADNVIVIGATNRPDALDPALRRRFDREINICEPDESARKEILSILTSNFRFDGLFDLHEIAKFTSGFVGADLVTLVDKALRWATKRIINERMKRVIDQRRHEIPELMSEHIEEWRREPLSTEELDEFAFIKISDFEQAFKKVQPSLRREGFASIPKVKWEDVGGLDHLRKEFERYIVRRIKYPEDYEALGINLETGFLLYGPPGCGKTLIAKAVAGEAGASFIHIEGAQLLNKYVGESELAVRTLFSRARSCAPCIIFFDEIDSLTKERGKEGGWVTERLLNQLLIELDGGEHRHGVFVIGATNRPEMMDRALLRPGRFGKLLYVPLPGLDERVLILKALARTMTIDATVDLSAIARMEVCENLSGADLRKLMSEAAMAAWDEKDKTVKSIHFEMALSKISPSVSNREKQYYQRLSESFKVA
ncbi:cell division control protein 48 homolog C [Vigna radiata var. radiata]|uniref:Cell division control protein 48 homolog C n=1 Tax=Vigna radiata var. radiata TaxID=3916 RepID=A0A1S3VL44_VIGRR|nr:cell division control protein 48 homolog C [Vigna radiata var. radiata]